MTKITVQLNHITPFKIRQLSLHFVYEIKMLIYQPRQQMARGTCKIQRSVVDYEMKHAKQAARARQKKKIKNIS